MSNQATYLKLIKEQLLSGKRISVLSVLATVKTLECRKYVSQLRRAGLDIKSMWVTAHSEKRHKIYWLNKDAA